MPSATDMLRVATGAPGLLRRLTDADAGLRRALPTSRRLALLQAGGGAGATVTAARLGTALAVRRAGDVLAVDAARGDAALAASAGAGAPPSLEHAARRAAGITRTAQVRDLGPQTPAGLVVVGDGGAPASPGQSRAVLDGAGRFFDVVLTDWGVRDPEQAAEVAAASHVVAVVARADRGPAERGLARAEHLTATGGAPVHLVLVDVGGTGGTSPAVLARAGSVPVHRLPHVPALGAGRPAAVRLSLSVRSTYAALAAALLGASLGASA